MINDAKLCLWPTICWGSMSWKCLRIPAERGWVVLQNQCKAFHKLYLLMFLRENSYNQQSVIFKSPHFTTVAVCLLSHELSFLFYLSGSASLAPPSCHLTSTRLIGGAVSTLLIVWGYHRWVRDATAWQFMTTKLCHLPSLVFTYCVNTSMFSLKLYHLHVSLWSCAALSLRLVEHRSDNAAATQQPRSAEHSEYEELHRVTQQGTGGDTLQPS